MSDDDDLSVRDHSGVVLTNDDAAESKLSAVSAGYYSDPFVAHFVRKPARKPPLINRGHFARVSAIDTVVRRFLALGGRQVVVLGCGYDTTFFRLSSSGAMPEGCVWVDVDFPQVVRTKASVVRSTPAMCACVGGASTPAQHSGRVLSLGSAYHLAGADLTKPAELAEALAGLDRSAPCLFVSECVLVYLDPREGDAVIAYAASQFARAVFVAYEPFKPSDPFGARMVANLRARGCPLRSVDAYPDEGAMRVRYMSLGWPEVAVYDMNAVYGAIVGGAKGENARLARLEMLDEVEEWHLILAHYFVLVASRPIHSDPAVFWTTPTPLFSPAP
eukprot:m51a1_g4014 hypothetical protein (332) ;mRNA; f:562397-563754